MSELSDEASESEQLGGSLSLWLGGAGGQLVCPEELDVPLDLHTACSIGQYDVVAECVRRGGVDLDGKNIGGWTPLMYAAYIGHDNIANLLLEAGVGVGATTPRGQTPLMLAASCGNESIAYFLLQQGAELEAVDTRGWTALFHCTSAGHQQMVKFLLDNNANANIKEPISGFSPLMEAAASGHEIIVQYLLELGVNADVRNANGETARTLAMLYGHTKIASLIDMHSVRLKQDLSSSDDSDGPAPRTHFSRSKVTGPSIHDGPQAIAKFGVGGTSRQRGTGRAVAPAGYVTFGDEEELTGGISYRDVTSPINELDGQSNSSRDESPFFDHDTPTVRSSSSSESLSCLIGLSREASLESNEDSDQAKRTSSRRTSKSHHHKGKSRHGDSATTQPGSTGNCGMHSPSSLAPSYSGPKDLAEFLEQIGCSKYLSLLEEQDIDLRIFLTLTENDLKEVGITLFGPKRKMTSAIARWHSSARPPSDALEQAYADQLEAKMQEMAIQLHKRCEEVDSLRGQVSQERELRTVMEGCLMEDKMSWRRVCRELLETNTLTEGVSTALQKLRASQKELFSRLRRDGVIEHLGDSTVKLKSETGSEALEDELKSLTMTELMSKVEVYETDIEKGLQIVAESLRGLRAPEKGAGPWEES